MSTDTSAVLGEISQRLSDMASATGEDGPQVVPPLLILGTSERVGSNWISDALRPAAVQHNEPFRQQIGPAHPWSALNPGFAGSGSGLPAIGAFGRHWLVSFAVSKYGPARQVVKETNGTWLLACEMPHERGGRLHYDPAAGQWQVSPGYGDYPVYWVTWIGAAAFAAWAGARLPARAELLRLTQDAALTGNAGYRCGDVTPVTEPGPPPAGIHHLLGNLQLWCDDGPGQALAGGPAVRWLYGTAWNTPATREAAQQPRWRHILGCSRGVGIRLVRDRVQQPVPVAALAGQLAAWISSLAGRSRPLSEIDQQLIGALAASQADAGLGAHVAAGAGESRHG